MSSERRASGSPELLPSLPFAARVQRDSSLAERFVLIPNQHRITSRYYKSSDQIFDDLQQCLDQVEDGGQEIYVSFIQLHLALARRLPSEEGHLLTLSSTFLFSRTTSSDSGTLSRSILPRLHPLSPLPLLPSTSSSHLQDDLVQEKTSKRSGTPLDPSRQPSSQKETSTST